MPDEGLRGYQYHTRAVRLMKKQYELTRPKRDRERKATFSATLMATVKLKPAAVWVNAEPPREDNVR